MGKIWGMLDPKISKEKAIRTVFLIDPKGIVRASFFYPITSGRNFDEVTRLLAAIQLSDKNPKWVTPPSWQEGDDPIQCSACSSPKR